MSKCFNCGAEFEGGYCPECGVPANNSNPAPAPAPQAYNPPPVYNNINVNTNEVTSTAGWFGWQALIGFLGIIGIIIVLCVSRDQSAKNFAKASLIWTIIAIVIIILMLALGVFAGIAASEM